MKPTRSTRPPSFRVVRRARAGFTLVELLTVIAIIAILMAIVLPVFTSVKENARRTACMSNMQQMYTALRQYELDNRRYPDFLFGPAIKAGAGPGGCATVEIPANSGQFYLQMAGPTDTACTMQQASGTGMLGGEYADSPTTTSPFIGSLYPEYIKSLETFHCPNNLPDLGGADVQSDASIAGASRPAVGAAAVNGTAGSDIPGSTATLAYYKYDSYDANPRLNTNTLRPIPGTFETRYSRLWTRVRSGTGSDTIPANGTPSFVNYRNQMYWKQPSGDTYVTMCTYHAPKGKVTVLWLSGSAKAIDTNKLKNYSTGSSTPDISGTAGRDYDLYKLAPGD